MHFFSDPAFAIDRDGKVIAWNDGMVHLSGIEAADMIGKKDHEYAVPFFGRKVPMLVDMVNEDPVVSSGTTMRSSPGKTGRSSRGQKRRARMVPIVSCG